MKFFLGSTHLTIAFVLAFFANISFFINGRLTIHDAKYQYYLQLDPSEYPKELCLWYEEQMGKKLDLKNPRTFNEKIIWSQLYDSTPLKTHLTDKYLVRDWVKEKIGKEYLVPLLGVWDKFDDIDFDKLPEKFVLKCNHGCGWNIIVKDKSLFNKAEAKIKIDEWMNTNFAFVYGLQLNYKNISPKIIAEEFLELRNANGVEDYKFMCFDGKPYIVLVICNRHTDERINVYDLEWNLIPVRWLAPNTDVKLKKPKNFDEMVRLSTILSQGFNFVRCDFYSVEDKTYFGEMTFTPAGGATHLKPATYDEFLGELFDISKITPTLFQGK